MRVSSIERGSASAALALVAVLGCGKASVNDGAHVTEGTKPTAPPAQGSGGANVDYPAEPKAPPPVSPPAGQGLGVKLERHIAIDQFGYRPDMTKVAVLVDPELGWNGADAYSPAETLEVRRWSDGSVASSARVTPWTEGQLDQSSGDRGAWFNFTSLNEPGLYYVYDPRH